MTTTRRNALARCLPLLALAAGCTLAQAQAPAADHYPSKSIRFIVPYPAGGGTDIIARLLGQQLSTRWGQPVVVENKPGASGILGNDLVAKAPADGYTVLLGITTVVQIPSLYKKVPYKLADLAPVSQIAKSADVIFTPRSTGITSIQELVAQAKAKPGTLNAGSYGNATSSHLHIAQFNMKAGTDLMHVPYQGSGPEVAALLGGQLTSAFVDATAAYPHLKSDKLRALAVTGAQRHPALPDVPTLGEAGYKGFEANGWFAVFLPAHTPQPIIDKLGREVSAIVRTPEMSRRLSEMGLIPVGSLPQEFKPVLERDAAHWKSIVDAAKITLD